MRKRKFQRLFPALVAYQGVITHNWSKWWARLTDKHVTASASKVFHSFRHNFSDAVREATDSNENAVAALLGHKKHMYGQGLSLKRKAEIISKVEFPDVDFSLVKAAAKVLSRQRLCT